MNDKQTLSKFEQVNTFMGLKYSSIDDLTEILTKFIKSKKIGVDSTEDAIAIFMMSKELDLPFNMMASHSHLINGKPGVDIHIIKALLLRAGSIWWTLDKDYTPIHEYVSADGVKFTSINLPDNVRVVYSKEAKDRADAEGLTPVFPSMNNGKPIVVDYITQYTFHRLIKLPNGEFKEITTIGKFTNSEAIAAGLGIKANGEPDLFSPWIKYRRVMMQTRAFTYGARDIGSDLLFGYREISEVLDVAGENYEVLPEGEVVITNTATDSH